MWTQELDGWDNVDTACTMYKLKEGFQQEADPLPCNRDLSFHDLRLPQTFIGISTVKEAAPVEKCEQDN